MRSRLAVVFGLIAIAFATPVAADETTFCNVFITSLPYTITAQGHYCFNRNLSTAITSGAAITIASDFVVLDLNNFKLGGGAAGLGTFAVGVLSNDHRNITVRNGNIRGFYNGIYLNGTSTTSGGHLIENNLLDGNTASGLNIKGDAVVVRNNIISNTGGSTNGANLIYGIYAFVDFASVRDNVLANIFGTGSTTSTTGIATVCAPTCRGVHDHNVVNMGSPGGGTAYGIIGGRVCRDNTVLDASPGHGLGCNAEVGHNYADP